MATGTGAAAGVPAAAAGMGTGPTAPTGAETAGVARIKWGALAGLLGLALAIGGIFVALTALPLGSVVTSTSGSNAILDAILAAALAVVAGVFLALVSFVLYVAGFASLRQADRRFRTPMVLGLVGLVGLLLVGAFTVFYALAIHNALGCSVVDTTCQNNATTLARGIVVLAYVGGLLAFVGLIGTILGLFRFGSRYSSSLAKIGAVLYIIPFVAVLAPLLVLIGAFRVQRQLGRAPAVAMPVPPPVA